MSPNWIKHSEFLPLYQLILQGTEFFSRKSYPLTYKALGQEILSAGGLTSYLFSYTHINNSLLLRHHSFVENKLPMCTGNPL